MILDNQSLQSRSFGETIYNEARHWLRALIAKMIYTGWLTFHSEKYPYHVKSYAISTNHNISGFVQLDYGSSRRSLLNEARTPIAESWHQSKVVRKRRVWLLSLIDGPTRKRDFLLILRLLRKMDLSSSRQLMPKEFKDEYHTSNLTEKAIQLVYKCCSSHHRQCSSEQGSGYGYCGKFRMAHLLDSTCSSYLESCIEKYLCRKKYN